MLAPKKAAESGAGSKGGGAPRDATTTPSASAGEKRKRDAAPVVTVKRRGKACSSRFFGVRWFARDGKWQAQYTDEKGKLIHIALFDDEEAAARAYNAKIAELGLNRKTNPEVGGALVEKPGMSSEFHGVAWFARDETWQTQVTRSTKCGLDGKKQHLGYYDDEHSAALAADAFRRVATPGHEPHKINFPTLPELRKERLKTPMRVILTRDSNGTRRTIRGRLTKVKYDPSVQNRSAWSYRVDFEGHETEAADLGLKKRLWDTLVGDDSKFVSCTLAPDEKKKTRARA
ncbi:hypothetical protein SO694_00009262 [Aureococcus anophagefferens]|uniref:AP2/ERF domain-containing protein n=1 Tax=Aureococcus anophagefferens TaxID=44056 RepID=A0ABR1GEN4_AURAN